MVPIFRSRLFRGLVSYTFAGALGTTHSVSIGVSRFQVGREVKEEIPNENEFGASRLLADCCCRRSRGGVGFE
jgi:hypothetical protein